MTYLERKAKLKEAHSLMFDVHKDIMDADRNDPMWNRIYRLEIELAFILGDLLRRAEIEGERTY